MNNNYTIFDGSESEKIFFTSDTHFQHKNIINYCNRPFSDINEMDEELINRWNKKVPKDGIVFHLGDIGFGRIKDLPQKLNRLNGTIILIMGNHDWHRDVLKYISERFALITQQMNIRICGQHIILNHYPLLTFSGAYSEDNPSWQLFGHVHTSPYSQNGCDNERMKYLFPTQYDVGVDNNDFTPVSFNEVKKIINNQKNKSYV